MLPERNSKEIELFGEKLILHERNAGEVLGYFSFAETMEQTIGAIVYKAASAVSKALEFNRKPLPRRFLFWQRRKVKQFNHRLTVPYLIKHLSPLQLIELEKEVVFLEGFDISRNGDEVKKKMESPSAEM